MLETKKYLLMINWKLHPIDVVKKLREKCIKLANNDIKKAIDEGYVTINEDRIIPLDYREFIGKGKKVKNPRFRTPLPEKDMKRLIGGILYMDGEFVKFKMWVSGDDWMEESVPTSRNIVMDEFLIVKTKIFEHTENLETGEQNIVLGCFQTTKLDQVLKDKELSGFLKANLDLKKIYGSSYVEFKDAEEKYVSTNDKNIRVFACCCYVQYLVKKKRSSLELFSVSSIESLEDNIKLFMNNKKISGFTPTLSYLEEKDFDTKDLEDKIICAFYYVRRIYEPEIEEYRYYKECIGYSIIYDPMLNNISDLIVEDIPNYKERIEEIINPKELSFKVNEYITVRLVEGRTVIYLYDKKNDKYKHFRQCIGIVMDIPKANYEDFGEIDSIDEAIQIYKKRNKVNMTYIEPEQEFIGHCSNLQVWAENNYDTRILHSNISFPLLKALADLGDKYAKVRFKEEVISRTKSGYKPVIKTIISKNYFSYFNKEELLMLLEDLQDSLDNDTFMFLVRRLAGSLDEKLIEEIINSNK